jgi:hypothetical protein
MTDRTFNDVLRRAAGHLPASAVEPEKQRDGNLGGGQGGAAARRRPQTVAANAVVNERIRKAARVVRQAALRDGIAIDLDDPWGQ